MPANSQQTDAELPALVSFIEGMSEAAGTLAAGLLALLAALMLAELASRNLLGHSLHITWELSAYAMGSVFFLAAPSALRYGDHVRVGVLLEVLGARAARWVDFVVTIAAICVALYLAVSLGALTWRSLSGDVRSWSGYRIPLAIPQSILVIGMALLALQLAARATRLLLGLPGDANRSEGAQL